MQPGAEEYVRATQLDSNWLQILEGDIDTSHVGFLHYGGLKAEDQIPGSFSEWQLREKTAYFEVIDTEGGSAYGARRAAGPDQFYWRIAQWCFPFYTFTPPGVLGTKKGGNARVPMDDYHTLTFSMVSGRNRPAPGGANPALRPPQLDNTTDWHGRFRPEQNLANDFRIDREAQRRNDSSIGFTGITGIAMQDAAMTGSMGPIYDRSQEHLGSTDAMVIRVRRRLIAAVQAHMQRGVTPPGVDDPEAYRVRSGGLFLPPDADWVEATRELRQAFVEHPELDPAINGPL
jgi:hypothetical protein